MSGNHNQSLERALDIVDRAADAGVDAMKLQTYTADTLTIESNKADFMIRDKKSLWKGEDLYSLYKKAYTPWEWHKTIFERCKKLGILGFSTPFDETAVDFLETFDVPCYKVASFESNHLPLIKKIAKTGKPMIISTGVSTRIQLKEAVETARSNGCKQLILLKCTSTYPADPKDSNLVTIPHMKQLFGCDVGLSDHTQGIGVAVASVALGACLIEKHMTIHRADGGVDSAFSLEPEEMKQLVHETSTAWLSLGKVTYMPTKSEQSGMKFRRSIYAVRDMKKGDVLSRDTIRVIRPGYGLAPKYFEQVLGKHVRTNISRGTPLSFKYLKK